MDIASSRSTDARVGAATGREHAETRGGGALVIRLRGFRPGVPWMVLVAAATAIFLQFRGGPHAAYAGFGYIVIVLLASSRLGRSWGIALAVLCFLSFNFFLVQPYYTFRVREPVDWLVLVAFLLTSIIAAELLDRAQREAAEARARAEEVDRLSALGSESLSAGRAEESVQAIARVLRERLGLESCELILWNAERGETVPLAVAGEAGHRPEADDAAIREVAAGGLVGVEAEYGGLRPTPAETLADALGRYPAAHSVVVPLRVHGKVVGLFRLTAGDGRLDLDAPALRFTSALSYYAALGVERVRLVAEAEHADALREADRLKDALLASVSHDLRTPLTTIKALAREMREDGDVRAAVVEEESDRLNRFVTNLLDLSRLNSGAIPVSPELVPVEEVLGSALEQLATVYPDRDIQVRLPPGDAMLVGLFDPVLALRALVNLIENACRHAAGAPIEIDVTSDMATIACAVADRGPGVAESDRERIFEPFFRGGTVSATEGTGLGLSIARRLAEAQGGSVAYFPRPGGGSVFELRLPAAVAIKAPEPPPEG